MLKIRMSLDLLSRMTMDDIEEKYINKDGYGIIELVNREDGPEEQSRRTTFTAQILEEFSIDDGDQLQTNFRIKCGVSGRTAETTVSISVFREMTWPTETLGASGAGSLPGQPQ